MTAIPQTQGGKSIRRLIADRALLFGSFAIELASPVVPDALSQVGFHFIVIDSEHSAFDLSQIEAMVLACRAFGIAPIVRVSDRSHTLTTRVCDMRPDGLMFPGVETADEAGAAVAAAKYAPAGSRGACPMVRHERVLGDRQRQLNDELAIVVQVEGPQGVANATQIAAVPGVDGVFVGTYDLSQALGIPGQIDHPRVLDAGREIAASLPQSTALGVYVHSANMAREWIGVGATFIAYATDGQLFLRACKRVAQELNEINLTGTSTELLR